MNQQKSFNVIRKLKCNLKHHILRFFDLNLTHLSTSTENFFLLFNFNRTTFFLILIKTSCRRDRWICVHTRWIHETWRVLRRAQIHRRVGRRSWNCTICSFINVWLIVAVIIRCTRRIVILTTWVGCRIGDIVGRQFATLTWLLRIWVYNGRNFFIVLESETFLCNYERHYVIKVNHFFGKIVFLDHKVVEVTVVERK